MTSGDRRLETEPVALPPFPNAHPAVPCGQGRREQAGQANGTVLHVPREPVEQALNAGS